MMRTVVVLAAANLVLGLIAMVTGSMAVSTVTGVLAVVLLVIVVAVVRRSRPSQR
jgi:hypothetical protein